MARIRNGKSSQAVAERIMAARAESVAVPNIEELFQPTHDERARQSMVSMLRKRAIIDLRAELKRDYESRVEPALRARDAAPRNWRDIERAMENEESYRFYSTLRYHAQEMCYLSVQPAVERALPEMISLAKDLAVRNPSGGSLRLAPNFEVPRYVTVLDVHLAPGWVATEHTADDVAQGAVVGFGGKVFTGQHPYRKRAGVVAESIAHWLKATRPGFAPRRLLDMATTNGKNLLPYKTASTAVRRCCVMRTRSPSTKGFRCISVSRTPSTRIFRTDISISSCRVSSCTKFP
jgi:hypothetical protein